MARRSDPEFPIWGCFFLVVFAAALCLIGLGAWALIEVVRWLTSK